LALDLPIFVSEWGLGGVESIRFSAASRRRTVSASLNWQSADLSFIGALNMAKGRTRKRPGAALPYTDKVFLPYVAALGQLALAWNGLHEILSILFCNVMGGGAANQPLAIWHALKVDRAQRDILLAALNSHTRGAYPVNFERDIQWICSRADVLEDIRNDALHSPLWAQEQDPGNIVVAPLVALGHVRAQKLLNKDLLAEFRWCRDAAVLLADFAFRVDRSLADYMTPWPQRPSWPARPQTNASKPLRPARQAKRPPPPQS